MGNSKWTWLLSHVVELVAEVEPADLAGADVVFPVVVLFLESANKSWK